MEQICQAQYASVEAREGDMERLGPVDGDRVQPVARSREGSGHRGEGVDVLERDTDEFAEDRGAFPGRTATVGESGDAAGRVMVAPRPAGAKWTADVEARTNEPFPAARRVT